MRYFFVTTDVFTDRAFGGNQLAVLPDATGLTTAQMQAVAAEFGYSESTFVTRPTLPGHDVRVRIFTPKSEIPFAGHPTVGTALVLARMGREGADPHRLVMEQAAGTVPVDLTFKAGRAVAAEFTAPRRPAIGEPHSVADAARWLGLDVADIAHERTPPVGVSCGLPFLFVELRDLDALGRAHAVLTDADAADDLVANGIFAFTRKTGSNDIDVRARMFAPLHGIVEDPATGSACAALAGLLATREAKRDGWMAWRIAQGVEMGRPSLIDARASVLGGSVTEVRVAGAAVPVAEGHIDIPTE